LGSRVNHGCLYEDRKVYRTSKGERLNRGDPNPLLDRKTPVNQIAGQAKDENEKKKKWVGGD